MDWNEIGFEPPYQASNGLEAYELAQDIRPDLVFADIKMPVMDGLELAKRLKESLPETYVVIFSGHDEFKYAQESIGLGVIDYILKPLGSVTLTQKFKDIRHKLDQESKKKSYIEKMRGQIQESLPLLKENFLNGLVCSPHHNIYSEQRMASLDIHFGGGPYVITVIEPNFSQLENSYIDLYLFGMKNIIRESIGYEHWYFTDATGRLVIIFSMNQLLLTSDEEIFQRTLEVLNWSFSLHLDLEVTIGIGRKVDFPKDLHLSYQDALSAIDSKYTMGKGKIYDYKDLHDIKAEFYFPEDINKTFISSIKANNQGDIRHTVLELCDRIQKEQNITLPNLKFIFIDLVTELTKMLAENKDTSPKLWSRNLDMYKTIEAYKSTDYVAQQLTTLACDIADSIAEISLSSRKKIVMQAIEFMKDNFSDIDLSLKSVANNVAVSAGYLSAIFKSESGTNFNQYLSMLRIDEAKKLLATTDLTVYDIAYRTGHANAHYFSLNFKKQTSQTPTDYRSQRMNQ